MPLPPSVPTDILEATSTLPFVVVFMQSRGKGARLSVSIARGATEFIEFEADATAKGYVAGFDASPDSLSRLRALMPIISAWRATTLLIKGRVVRWTHRIESTLDCFARSFEHESPEEWCCVVRRLRYRPIGFPIAAVNLEPYNDGLPPPAPEPVPAVVLPCRLLSVEQVKRNSIESSLRSATLSQAIESEVSWCPRFDIDRMQETTLDE